MSELRQDPTTGAWTIIAPDRGRRPGRQPLRDAGVDLVPPFDPSCPFCPGNEALLPGIISELRGGEPPGWHTRVVSNKYPALAPDDGAPRAASAVPGFGYHEVVVETHRHDADLSTLAAIDIAAVVRTYRSRYLELMSRPGVAAVVVFRNRGSRAGASLRHPHSQIVALGRTTPRLAAATTWARTIYAEAGQCPTCREVDLELRNGERIVEDGTSFLLLVPFAAASPYELWIVPKRHAASFSQIDDTELAEFGRLLQCGLSRLAAVLDNAPYNYAIESGPEDETHAAYAHWRLRIVPQMVAVGGFELGAGLPINPSQPEDDARALRAVAEEDAT